MKLSPRFSMSQWYPKIAGYDQRGWHPDPYVGRYGNSWLHRWARGAGMEVRWEPDAPDWVTAYYEGG